MSDPSSPDSQSPDHEQQDGSRRRLEGIIPDLIKRLVEAGSERIGERQETLRQLLGELRLPKEALGVIMAQLEETKSGIYATVAREVREFLAHSNLGEELTRVLTRLSFEIKTEIRFVPNEQHVARPSVRAQARLKREESEAPPDPAEAAPNLEQRTPAHEQFPASRDEAADRRVRAAKEELE